jgi:hypothetical protein
MMMQLHRLFLLMVWTLKVISMQEQSLVVAELQIA